MRKELKSLSLLIKVTLSYIVNSIVFATLEAYFSGLAWESNHHITTCLHNEGTSYRRVNSALNLKVGFPRCHLLRG